MHKVRLLVLLSGVLLVTSFSHAQTATGETLCSICRGRASMRW